MARIAWDTNLFVYLMEDTGALGAAVAALRRRMVHRGDTLCASWLTYGELLVRPRREKREDLVAAYGRLLRSGVELIEFGEKAAGFFVDIRLLGTKPADAIQLACAAQARVDLFITNDEKLVGLRVPQIAFITTIESAPL